MTVPATARRAGPLLGNGVTTSFPFSFRIFQESDIRVVKTLAGVDTNLVLNSDYTVAVNVDQANNPGGAIIPTVVAATGVSFVIIGNLAYDQSIDLPDGGAYRAEQVEDGLDKLAIQVQQIKEQADRSLAYTAATGAGFGTLPDAAARSNKFLSFDADGVVVMSPGTGADAGLRGDLASKIDASKGSSLSGHGGNLNYAAGTIGAVLNDVCVNVKMFPWLAKGDLTTDDTVALNLAAAAGYHLFMPDGGYRVTDRINLVNGQILQGSSRHKAYFSIGPDFNMAATGVVKLGTGEPGAQLFDVGFKFTQADQGVRANVTAYPPAIDANAIPRFVVDRIRIESGYDGIRALGNSGGCYIGFVEIGTLNKGIEIDGALDFVHGGHWHFWPFGVVGTPTLLNGVYYDGNTQSVSLGKADGLTVDSISMFRSYMSITANADAGIPSSVGRISLDGDGSRLLVSGGVTSVGQLYSTKSNATSVVAVTASAGSLVAGQFHSISNSSAPGVSTTGTGSIKINGGRLAHDFGAASWATCAAGALALRSVEFVPFAGVTYSVPHVDQSGTGVLTVENCTWPLKGAGGGTAVRAQGDAVRNLIAENNFADWDYTVPTGALTGSYGPNRVATANWTPVITFATPGNFVPTYSVRVGKVKYVSGGAWIHLRLIFDTNAFTTASGGARITGLPFVNYGVATSLPIEIYSKIGLGAGYTQVAGEILLNGDVILLQKSGPTKTVAGVDILDISPSQTALEIRMSGFVPTY